MPKAKMPKHYISKFIITAKNIEKIASMAEEAYAKQFKEGTPEYKKGIEALRDWQIKEVQKAAKVIARGGAYTPSETPVEIYLEKRLDKLNREMLKKTRGARKQLGKRLTSRQKAIIHEKIRKVEEEYEKQMNELEKLREDIEKARRELKK